MNDRPEYYFKIPRDLLFMELGLKECPEGKAMFSWEPLRRICEESGVDDEELLYSSRALIPLLVAGWLASIQPIEVDLPRMNEWLAVITRWLKSTMEGVDADSNVPRVQVCRVGEPPIFN